MISAVVMSNGFGRFLTFFLIFTDSRYICSGANDASSLSEVEFLWPALMIASSAFQAGASILKVMTRIIIRLWLFCIEKLKLITLKTYDFYVHITGACFH